MPQPPLSASTPAPAPDPRPARPARGPVARWTRRAAALLAVLLVFILGWTLLNRALAPGRAVSSVAGATQPDRPTSDTFRVAAWNIAHARGPDGTNNWAGPREQRLEDIADLIATWDADVVVLNEVDFDCTWSGRVDQAAYIADRAGYPHYATQRNYDVSLPFFRLRFGNAVLSRWPITRAQRVQLPHVARWEAMLIGRKDALRVSIQRDQQLVRMLAVHLDVRDRDVRQDSVPRLARFASNGRPPLVVAGDFNCKLIELNGLPLGPEVRRSAGSRLRDLARLAWVSPEVQATLGGSFPAAQPNRLIDYILADPELPMTRLKVVNSTLSDHRPLVADLELPRIGGYGSYEAVNP